MILKSKQLVIKQTFKIMYFKITSVYNNYSSANGDNNNINISPSTSPRGGNFGGSAPQYLASSPLNNGSGSYSTTAATTSCSSVTSGFDVTRHQPNSFQDCSYQRESQVRRERTLSREEINALVLTKLIVSRFGESDDDSSRDGEE